MTTSRKLLAALLATLTACGGDEGGRVADVAFVNARGHTLNVAQPWVETVLIAGDAIADAGAKLTFGSDFPASGAGTRGLSPLLQIEIGRTRQAAGKSDAPIQPRESERLSVEALSRDFTIDAAYQLPMEDSIGSIEIGKKADLVVLDRNMFDIDPYEIHRTEVLMTMLDGEFVIDRD